MRKIFILLCLLCLGGCTVIEEYGEDYLNTDEWNDMTMKEAVASIKYDYLNIEEPILEESKKDELEYLAYKTLTQSEYADQFQGYAPHLDQDVGMPEAFRYVFIHFPRFEDSPLDEGTTFLVVINRFHRMIEYAAPYKQPDGDPFYRYSKILTQIRENASLTR